MPTTAMRSDEENKSGGSNISSRGRRPETVARQRIRGQIGFSSMAAQNEPQRVIKVSADEYLEELKKMYFKTKYIKRGHTQTRAVCPSMTRAVWPSMGASALPSAAMSTPTAHQRAV